MGRLLSGSCTIASLLFSAISTASILPRQIDGSAPAGPSPTVNMAPSKPFETVYGTPTADIGLGSFYQYQIDSSSKHTPDQYGCGVQIGGDVLGCKAPQSLLIGGDKCASVTGRHSANLCGGVITVDYQPEPNGPTYIHYTEDDGAYTGCMVPSGQGANGFCYNNQLGWGAFGSPKFVGGWCVAEILQLQKTDPSAGPDTPAGSYHYSVSIYDGDNKSAAANAKNGRSLIASTQSNFSGPAHEPIVVDFGTSNTFLGNFTIVSGGKISLNH